MLSEGLVGVFRCGGEGFLWTALVSPLLRLFPRFVGVVWSSPSPSV